MSYAHNCTHFTGTKRFHKVHRKKKVKKRNGPHQNKYALERTKGAKPKNA